MKAGRGFNRRESFLVLNVYSLRWML